MYYIDSINGYEVYEFTRSECREAGYEYPTFAAFLNPDRVPRLGREECSMELYHDLAIWCENN